MSAPEWAVESWGEELLFVCCFLGPQENEVVSCQEVTQSYIYGDVAILNTCV